VTPERAPAAKPEAPVTRPEAPAAKPAQPADPVSRRADDGDKTMLMPKFDPNATLQLNRPPLEGAAVPAQNVNGDSTTGRSVTEVLAAPPPAPLVGVHADAAAALPILNEETANRLRRPAPSGTSLVVLLPHDVGDFSRPHAVPSGELASDFVSANYGAGGDTVVVRLALCWDSDEAREPLDRLIREHGDKARAAADGSWVLAETAQGITFAWTRDSYSFSASCAKGLGPLSRFLWAFPY
ncbi:MAG TPA: hypothetical protein VFV17_09780, partial [Usitatibacteraceae bacterium]|nr:hypothetical protein [Usitatibacteraceae bacterium]